MSRIYSDKNRIKFTDISERYSIPKQYKAKQSEIHGALISYVVDHFKNTNKFKKKVVDAVNVLTYCLLNNETPPYDWRTKDPLDDTILEITIEQVEESLGDYYLVLDAIEWDVIEREVKPQEVQPQRRVAAEKHVQKSELIQSSKIYPVNSEAVSTESKFRSAGLTSVKFDTPKEDLYIQAPKYPRFDTSDPWLSMRDGSDRLVIYRTLPKIPTKQNEISVTTDVNSMTDPELLNLYPNHIIRTRSSIMYEVHEGIDYDDDLGCIIPIAGFTKEQVIDNIIRYPHLYKLKREAEDALSNFYEDIEIDGELCSIASVWDSLAESAVIPKQSDFIKEYVARRYILEKENGVKHKYPMYGTLKPFLTLFMPAEKYEEKGYSDPVSIAKQCVISRVSFKQSRNPILRRLNMNG